ncbi:MAG: hypothetical protein ACRDQ1_12255, partial [Sciscionella sp.]
RPAVAQLIHDGLGTRPDPTFVAACADASGGNPFALRELIFDLAAAGVSPGAAQAAGVTERVPGQVGRAVLARLGRLDEAAVRLARALAVLGEGTELRVAAALANLDRDAATEAADALLAADLFDNGRPLGFVHPLVRSAVYDQLAPGARSRAHARAVPLLSGEGAGPERVAVHLLACDPAGDADAVRVLRAAAAAALGRGAPETAVTYLRRALAEPPERSVRAAVLGELGNAERVGRDPAAVEHLEQAAQTTIDPMARARLADQLANMLYAADSARSIVVLQAALKSLSDRDPDVMVRLQAHKAALEILSIHPTEAGEGPLGRLRGLAARGVPASRWAQLALAGVLAVRGESCHEVAELVERGWDDGRFVAEETSEAMPTTLAVWATTLTDELDRAHALAEEMLADALARGSVLGLVAATARRGLVALRRGALAEAEAEADTRAAFELATEHGLTLTVAIQTAALGLTLLERGELDQAAGVLEGVTLAPTVVGLPTGAVLLEARGRVRLARGQRDEAIADLRHCGQLADRSGSRNPNYLAWRSTLALALAPEHSREARELAQTELQQSGRRVRRPSRDPFEDLLSLTDLLKHRETTAVHRSGYLGRRENRRPRLAECCGSGCSPVSIETPSAPPLHEQQVDLLLLRKDQVHHLPCLAGTELPASDCTLGVILVLRPAVPRRQLEHFQYLGVGVQGIGRQ